MKAAAAAAIEEHKAARTKAIADKLAENKAAESAAADALAGETNPWNTICTCSPPLPRLPALVPHSFAPRHLAVPNGGPCVNVSLSQTGWSRRTSGLRYTLTTRSTTTCFSTLRSRARMPRRARVSPLCDSSQLLWRLSLCSYRSSNKRVTIFLSKWSYIETRPGSALICPRCHHPNG